MAQNVSFHLYVFIQNREKLSKSELERHKRHLTILFRLQSVLKNSFKLEDLFYWYLYIVKTLNFHAKNYKDFLYRF